MRLSQPKWNIRSPIGTSYMVVTKITLVEVELRLENYARICSEAHLWHKYIDEYILINPLFN